MKIIFVQSGHDHEFFLMTSLLIGIKKRYPMSHVWWMGEPKFFDVLKYNNRVNELVDINREITLKSLYLVYGADLCINPCLDKKARNFASQVIAKQHCGFLKDKTADNHAQFFQNVLEGNLITNKTCLDLYYSLVGLKWKGEGYGLSYYPKLKQIKGCGYYAQEAVENCERINLPKSMTEKIDVINQYSKVITDNLFVFYCASALRKKVTFLHPEKLTYRLEMFK